MLLEALHAICVSILRLTSVIRKQFDQKTFGYFVAPLLVFYSTFTCILKDVNSILVVPNFKIALKKLLETDS